MIARTSVTTAGRQSASLCAGTSTRKRSAGLIAPPPPARRPRRVSAARGCMLCAGASGAPTSAARSAIAPWRRPTRDRAAGARRETAARPGRQTAGSRRQPATAALDHEQQSDQRRRGQRPRRDARPDRATQTPRAAAAPQRRRPSPRGAPSSSAARRRRHATRSRWRRHQVETSVAETVLLREVAGHAVAPSMHAGRLAANHQAVAGGDQAIAQVVVVPVAERFVEPADLPQRVERARRRCRCRRGRCDRRRCARSAARDRAPSRATAPGRPGRSMYQPLRGRHARIAQRVDEGREPARLARSRPDRSARPGRSAPGATRRSPPPPRRDAGPSITRTSAIAAPAADLDRLVATAVVDHEDLVRPIRQLGTDRGQDVGQPPRAVEHGHDHRDAGVSEQGLLDTGHRLVPLPPDPPNRSATTAPPTAARSRQACGAASTRSIAAASASASPTATTWPPSSAPTTSPQPLSSATTTGVPHSSASSGTSPNTSSADG